MHQRGGDPTRALTPEGYYLPPPPSGRGSVPQGVRRSVLGVYFYQWDSFLRVLIAQTAPCPWCVSYRSLSPRRMAIVPWGAPKGPAVRVLLGANRSPFLTTPPRWRGPNLKNLGYYDKSINLMSPKK